MHCKLAGLCRGAKSANSPIVRLTSGVIRTAAEYRAPPCTILCPTAWSSRRNGVEGAAGKSSRMRPIASACCSIETSARTSSCPARRTRNRAGLVVQSMSPSSRRRSSLASKRLNFSVLEPALQIRTFMVLSFGGACLQRSLGQLLCQSPRQLRLPHILLQLARVGVKLAYPFAQLFGVHRVFVMHPTECLLVEMNLGHSRRESAFHAQAARDLALGLFHLLQEVGADREQVAAGEADDLVHLAKTGPHDLGLVTELLEVVVNPGDRRNARVFLGGDVAAPLLLVPVVDPADERRDQRHASLGAGHGLGKAEQKGQVAVNALALELLGGANTFPSAGDLDEDALSADT